MAFYSPSTFPRSNVLILGADSISSLVPSTLISQIEALLESHRLQDAVELADTQRKKHEANMTVDEDEADELRYVYQRLGFQSFLETLFEDAGTRLFTGELDPRVLISFFPELRPALEATSSKDETVDMFTGVADKMPVESSVDEIIHTNIVQNYSPHMSPSTRAAPPTAELGRILREAAGEMMERFLRRWRIKFEQQQQEQRQLNVAEPGGDSGSVAALAASREIRTAVDTALALLYILPPVASPPVSPSSSSMRFDTDINKVEETKAARLDALLSDTTALYDVGTVVPALREHKQWGNLCKVMRRQGDWEGVCEVLAGLAEGSLFDPGIHDPMGELIALLNAANDRNGQSRSSPVIGKDLVRKWGVWIAKRDVERGLQLLIDLPSSSMSVKRKPPQSRKAAARWREEEAAEELAELGVLEELSVVNPEAEARYLEWVFFRKGRVGKTMRTKLVISCIERLRAFLKEESTQKLWRAKASSYASTSTTRVSAGSGIPTSSTTPFLSYFAATTPDSPSKLARLQTVLVLAGSGEYEVSVIKERLETLERETFGGERARYLGTLALEKAVIEAKLGNHRDALHRLVHDLHDAVSAEAYCTLGGEVVSRRVAMGVADEGSELRKWVEVLFPAPPSPVSLSAEGVEGKEKKKELLGVLLEVYMHDKNSDPGRAAALLDSQAVNLDALDVVTLLPPEWPLALMTPFLSRTFRRTLHNRHEGKIKKHISAGQNLEIKDTTWLTIHEAGMVIEEEDDDDYEDEDDEYEVRTDTTTDGEDDRDHRRHHRRNRSYTSEKVVLDQEGGGYVDTEKMDLGR